MTELTLEKETVQDEKARNQWWDVWEQFRSHKGAMAGLFFLTFITLFCTDGPMIWDVDPGKLDIRNKDVRPIYTAIWDGDANTSWARPMGTDHLGRDIMSNIMQGGRISLAVGWTAMVLAIVIGTLIGDTYRGSGGIFPTIGLGADAVHRPCAGAAVAAALAGDDASLP